jgi:hypothetical protein
LAMLKGPTATLPHGDISKSKSSKKPLRKRIL